jgi:hypothetical protein
VVFLLPLSFSTCAFCPNSLSFNHYSLRGQETQGRYGDGPAPSEGSHAAGIGGAAPHIRAAHDAHHGISCGTAMDKIYATEPVSGFGDRADEAGSIYFNYSQTITLSVS